MPNPAGEIAAFKSATNIAISTKTAISSIEPTDVGGQVNALADLVLPYLLTINNQAVTGGTSAPIDSNGSDLDLYFRISGTTFKLYRKEGGTWLEKVSLTFGVSIPDGAWTLRASINAFDVTVTPGIWFIDNVEYTIAFPTLISVDAADTNYDRYDLIFADDTENIGYTAGTASGSPVFPTPGAGQVAVDYIIVPSASSGNAPYLLNSGFGSTNNNISSLQTLTYNQASIANPSDPFDDRYIVVAIPTVSTFTMWLTPTTGDKYLFTPVLYETGGEKRLKGFPDENFTLDIYYNQ